MFFEKETVMKRGFVIRMAIFVVLSFSLGMIACGGGGNSDGGGL